MEHTIAHLFQHVANAATQQADQALQEQLGIGTSQLRILRILQEQPYAPQRQLADHLGQTEASISRQVKLMVEKGILVSHTNPRSKRQRLAQLTPKGMKLTVAASEILHHHQATLHQTLSEKQQKQLAEILTALHTQCCQPGKVAACDQYA